MTRGDLGLGPWGTSGSRCGTIHLEGQPMPFPREDQCALLEEVLPNQNSGAQVGPFATDGEKTGEDQITDPHQHRFIEIHTCAVTD
mmetsp:Transcript_5798/g.10398  ORF Transcript_5798/g.10398 Transcript_5798/m.10398 type:complete len:86 (+) Transcript_5798:696-953(+)